jgi:hypothetical protein
MKNKKIENLLAKYKNQKIVLPDNFSQKIMLNIKQKEERRLIIKISLISVIALSIGLFIGSFQSLWQSLAEYGTFEFIGNFISELSFSEFVIIFNDFIPWSSIFIVSCTIILSIIMSLFYYKISHRYYVNGYHYKF